MLNTRTLRQINDRPREVNRPPLLAAGGGSVLLAALLYALLALPLLALALLLAGSLLVLGFYRAQKARTTVALTYEGKLDEETNARFSTVREVCEALTSPEAASAHPPERGSARIGLLETPGIRADVPIWGFEAGDERLLFFPEGVLRYKNDLYEPFSYGSVEASLFPSRSFEGETVVEICVPRGAGMWLRVSDRRAAFHFIRAFGAADPRGGKEKEQGFVGGRRQEDRREASSGTKSKTSDASTGDQERAYYGSAEGGAEAAAYRVLGLPKGASQKQIGAAYKQMARTYHPDKVAGESQEVREFAEERMKEINAAYSELKLWGEHSAAVGAD